MTEHEDIEAARRRYEGMTLAELIAERDLVDRQLAEAEAELHAATTLLSTIEHGVVGIGEPVAREEGTS